MRSLVKIAFVCTISTAWPIVAMAQSASPEPAKAATSPPPPAAAPAPTAPAPASAATTTGPKAAKPPRAKTESAAQAKSTELPNGADQRAVAAQAIPVGKSCFRMTLSDIQVGRDETIASTRKKMAEEYAPATARQRGLKGKLSAPTNEAVSCEHYLWVPLLGQEYKCFVTATFCAK